MINELTLISALMKATFSDLTNCRPPELSLSWEKLGELSRSCKKWESTGFDPLDIPEHPWLRAMILSLLDRPFPQVVKAVRQFSYLFYKYEVPNRKNDKEAIKKFTDIEQNMPDVSGFIASPIARRARGIISRCLQSLDPTCCRPHDAGGAVMERVSPASKRVVRTWPKSCAELGLTPDYIGIWPVEEMYPREALELPSRLVLVPKDLRGPRIICVEPRVLMAVQQGYEELLVQHLERSRYVSGTLNFGNQNINRELARKGSINGRWATLDMQDASDWVSLELVEYLFGGTLFGQHLVSLRSRWVTLSDHSLRLRKYATMGSALCFPVESLVFWALIRAIVPSYVWAKSPACYVYGDDLAVETTWAQKAINVLELAGLRVNHGKSFLNGKFRESCGGDFYDGVLVTPIRIKTRIPSAQAPRLERLAYWTELVSRLFYGGLYQAAVEAGKIGFTSDIAPDVLAVSGDFVDDPKDFRHMPGTIPRLMVDMLPKEVGVFVHLNLMGIRRRFNRSTHTLELKVPLYRGERETWVSKDTSHHMTWSLAEARKPYLVASSYGGKRCRIYAAEPSVIPTTRVSYPGEDDKLVECNVSTVPVPHTGCYQMRWVGAKAPI